MMLNYLFVRTTTLLVALLMLSPTAINGDMGDMGDMGEMEEALMVPSSALKIRMNPAGVDIMREVAVILANNWVKNAPLQDFMDTVPAGLVNVQFQLYSQVIESVNMESAGSTIETIEPNLVRINVTEYKSNIAGMWSANVTVNGFVIGMEMGTYTGEIDMFHSSVTFASTVVDGQVVMSSQDCSFETSGGRMTLVKNDDSAASYTIDNAITSTALSNLRGQITSSGCNTFIPSLVEEMNRLFAAVPTSVELLSGAYIDLTITEDPSIMDDSICLGFDGKVFPDGQQNITYNFGVSPSASMGESSGMGQILLNDYVLKTFLNTLYQTDSLNLSIDPSQISFAGLDISVLIANLIPDFNAYLPYPLMLTASPNSVPEFMTSTGMVSISGDFSVAMISKVNGTDLNLLSLGLVFSATGTIQASGSTIGATINDLSLQTTMQSTMFENFDFDIFQVAFDLLLPSVITPGINELLDQGFTLPNFVGLRFTNVGIMMKEKAIEVSGDIENVLNLALK